MLDIFDYGNWDSIETWWNNTIYRITDELWNSELNSNLDNEVF